MICWLLSPGYFLLSSNIQVGRTTRLNGVGLLGSLRLDKGSEPPLQLKFGSLTFKPQGPVAAEGSPDIIFRHTVWSIVFTLMLTIPLEGTS